MWFADTLFKYVNSYDTLFIRYSIISQRNHLNLGHVMFFLFTALGGPEFGDCATLRHRPPPSTQCVASAALARSRRRTPRGPSRSPPPPPLPPPPPPPPLSPSPLSVNVSTGLRRTTSRARPRGWRFSCGRCFLPKLPQPRVAAASGREASQ